MKKYLINSREVGRKEFFRFLRQDCIKITSTTAVGGWCGVDVAEPDDALYRQSVRRLRQGHMLCFFDKGRTYSQQ